MRDPTAAQRYLVAADTILTRIRDTQLETIEQAAEICANTIAGDGLVFCWGGGHSRMSVEERCSLVSARFQASTRWSSSR